MRAVRYAALLWIPTAIWLVALLQCGEPLTWDELEYFRATRWVAEGQLPYRDFWEHHLPLQWLAFAPMAKLVGGGIGVGAVVAMRWAQLPLWIGSCALLWFLARRWGTAFGPRTIALLLLVSSRQFASSALQYRVDTLGNLAFLGGLALAARKRWVAFGVVMSAAVLANMRLAPLVIVAALLMLFVDDDRWRWNPRALRMSAGVAAVAASFVLWLVATSTWPAFLDGVVHYNRISNGLVALRAGNTLGPLLLAPLRNGDVSGVALWVLAIAGSYFALRKIRKGGSQQIVALLYVASVFTVAMTAVQYDYHLQTTWLLMVPLAAAALERWQMTSRRAQLLALAAVVVAIALNLVTLMTPSFGKPLDYQNRVMTEVHQRTRATDVVWDGSGYALHRQPAYRFWFLPSGVRLMAQRSLLERYQIQKNPPAAIIYNYRIHNWLVVFPDVRQYAVHHYVPLYRNLWVPGLSAGLGPGTSRLEWHSAAEGRYEVWASDLLASHPWIARPLEYGLIEGPDAVMMQIPLERLPRLGADSMEWIIDGVPQPRGTTTLVLRKGSRVELHANVAHRAGVLVVPQGIRTLCVAPEERFVF